MNINQNYNFLVLNFIYDIQYSEDRNVFKLDFSQNNYNYFNLKYKKPIMSFYKYMYTYINDYIEEVRKRILNQYTLLNHIKYVFLVLYVIICIFHLNKTIYNLNKFESIFLLIRYNNYVELLKYLNISEEFFM